MTAYVHNTVTGESWELGSLDEAEQFIDDRTDVDYEGVIGGVYQIDDMDDPDAEYDGQPDEAQEWYDFDPDC